MSNIPKPGDRIRLLAMPNDPDPIPAGEVGTVVSVARHGEGRNARHQVDVNWDHGRSLMLALPPDRIEIMDANC